MVPFVHIFTDANVSGYRACCAASKDRREKTDVTPMAWWHSDDMNEFRQEQLSGDIPTECEKCYIAESRTGHSFRTASNARYEKLTSPQPLPSNWQITMGNICNIGCWTCSETYSSVIETHKRKINILPENYVSPNKKFRDTWQDLQSQIMNSYELHDVVSINIVGGEPLHTKETEDFLKSLIEKGLSTRTALEIHTNAVKLPDKYQELLDKKLWKHIYIFISIDAVGVKAEWLRYGSDWNKIDSNIDKIKTLASYTECHAVVSVLNINDLPALQEYCDSKQLKLQCILVTNPAFMSLAEWPGDPDMLCDKQQLVDAGFEVFYNTLGSKAKQQSVKLLRDHITQFDGVRTPLVEFDKKLAELLTIT